MAGYFEQYNSLQQYKKAMSGAYENYGIDPNNLDNVGDVSISSANEIQNTIDYSNHAIAEKPHEDEKNWWEKVTDFWDTFQMSVTKGVLNLFDGIGDFFMGVAGGIGGAFGNREFEQNMQNAISYDWQTPISSYFVKTQFPTSWLSPSFYNGDNWGWNEQQEEFNRRKYNNFVQDKGAVDVIHQVGEVGGEIAANVVLSMFTGGAASAMAGAGKAAASTASRMLANAAIQGGIGLVRGTGNAYEKAVADGANLSDSGVQGYAFTSGAINGLISGASAAFGTGASIAGSKLGLQNGVSPIGAKIASHFIKDSTSEATKLMIQRGVSVVADLVGDVITDAGQELLEPVLQQMYDDEAIFKAYGTQENRDRFFANFGQAMIMSALTSVVSNGVAFVRGKIDDRKQSTRETRALDNLKAELQKEEDGRKYYLIDNMDKEDIKQYVFSADTSIDDLPKEIQYKVFDIQEKAKEVERTANVMREVIQNTDVGDAQQKARADQVLEQGSQRIETLKNEIEEQYYDLTSSVSQNGTTSAETASTSSLTRATKGTTINEVNNALSPRNTNYKKIDSLCKGLQAKRVSAQNGGGIEIKGSSSANTQDVFDTVLTHGQERAVGVITKNDIGVIIANETNQTMRIDTNKLSDMDISTIRDLILNTDLEVESRSKGDNTLVTFTDTNGKTTSFEITNGNIEKIYTNNQYPQWYVDVTDTRGAKLRDNDMTLIKQASNGRITDIKTVEDFLIDNIYRAKTGGGVTLEKVVIPVEDNARRLVASYNLDNKQDFYKNVDLVANDFLNSKIYYPLGNNENEVTLRDVLGTEKAVNDWKQDFKTALSETLDAQSKLSQNAKYREYYEQKIAKLNQIIDSLKERATLGLQTYKATERIKKKFAKTKPITTAGQDGIYAVDDAHFEKMAYATITDESGKTHRNFIFTTNQNTGLIKIDDLKVFFDNNKYLIPDENGRINPANQDDNDFINDISLLPNGEAFLEQVANVYDIYSRNPDYFTNEDAREILNMMRSMSFLMSEEGRRQVFETKASIKGAVIDATELSYQMTFNGNIASRTISDFMSKPTLMRAFVGSSGELFDMVVARPIDNVNKVTQFIDAEEKFVGNLAKDTNVKQSTLRQKTKIMLGGQEVEVTNDVLAQLYLNFKSSDNTDIIKKNGIVISNGKKKKVNLANITDTELINATAQLPQEVRTFADLLFSDVYNGRMRTAISEYSKAKLGYDITDGWSKDYLTLSRANRRSTLTDEVNLASSLSSFRLTNRVNSGLPVEIGGMIDSVGGYIKNVGQITLMDDVRFLNKAVNVHRGTNGLTEQEANIQKTMTIASAMDRVGLAEYFNEYRRAVNQMVDTQSSGILGKVFANAQIAKVGTNIGTWLKQPLDTTRLLDSVGLSNLVKGYARGCIMMITPNEHARFVEEATRRSAWFASVNKEKMYVTANTAAQSIGRVTEVLTKPMQWSSDFSYMIAYNSIKNYVESDPQYRTYSSSDKMAKTWELFDTWAPRFFSNSSAVDKSMVRSGQRGQIMQYLFSFFGADNQKNLDLVNELATGNKRSRQRQQGYESALATKQRAIEELNTKIDNLKQDLQTAVDENKPTSKIERQIYESQVTKSALEKSIVTTQNTIEAERAYQARAPRRAANYIGGMVVNASVATMIGVLNSILKGKTKPEELADEEKWKEIGIEAGVELTMSWVPIIGTLANAMANNKDVSLATMQDINNALNTLKNIPALISGEDKQAIATAYSALGTIGNLVGIPLSNILDYAVGAIENMGGDWGENIGSILRGYSSSYLKKRMETSLSVGNTNGASEELKASMALYKTGQPNQEVTNELLRLYKQGYNAIPKDIPDNITQGQQEEFSNYYYKSNKQVEDMLKSSVFKALDDENKARAIKYLYDGFYNASKAQIGTLESPNKLATIIRATGGRLDISKYIALLQLLKGYSAEQIRNGRMMLGLSNQELAMLLYLKGTKLQTPEKAQLRIMLSQNGVGNELFSIVG